MASRERTNGKRRGEFSASDYAVMSARIGRKMDQKSDFAVHLNGQTDGLIVSPVLRYNEGLRFDDAIRIFGMIWNACDS